jgi:hypothetical protein
MGCYFSGTVSQGWPGVSFHWYRVSELNVNVSSMAPCHRAERECQFNGTVSRSWTWMSVQWHRVTELTWTVSSLTPFLKSWTCIPVQWHRVSTPELAYQFSGVVSQLLNLYISSATSIPGTMKIIACYDNEGEEESFLWPDFSAWFLQVILREFAICTLTEVIPMCYLKLLRIYNFSQNHVFIIVKWRI